MTLSDLITRYPEHTEEATERTAIMQYACNIPAAEADKRAVLCIKLKYGLFEQGGLFGVDK